MVSNMFYFHPYLGKMNQFWLIFFKGVGSTTNQFRCSKTGNQKNPCRSVFRFRSNKTAHPRALELADLAWFRRPRWYHQALQRPPTPWPNGWGIMGIHGNQQGMINPTFKEFLLQYSRWVKQMRRLLHIGEVGVMFKINSRNFWRLEGP